jgi:hypothetical protein
MVTYPNGFIAPCIEAGLPYNANISVAVGQARCPALTVIDVF